jgi:pimeloyl-ACP methyl ester carboxylesterase
VSVSALERVVVEPRQETGRPVVLVHGFWADARCWANVQVRLSELGHRSTAISFRGHGNSEGRCRGASIGDYADDLAGVLDAHTGPAPIVVAHSAAANVVQRLLETRPLHATVWFAPEPTIGLLPVALRVLRRRPLAVAQAFGTWNLGPIVGTSDRLNDLCFSDQLTAADVANVRTLFGDESMRAFLDLLVFRRPRPGRQTACPSLVVGGAEDRLLSLRDLRRTVDRHPGATLHIIDGASHAMIADRHAAQCAEIIASWCAANAAVT